MVMGLIQMKKPKDKSKPAGKKKIEVLPCDFCGGEGVVYRWVMSLYWSAECNNPDCHIGWSNYFKTEKSALKHWNRRPKK